METIRDLEMSRQTIVQEMLSLRGMRRGTVTQQFMKVKLKSQKEPVRRGPYYVLSRREGKQTVSQRLRSKEEVEDARRQVAEHKRFRELCEEFEQLTERLGELEAEGESSKDKKKRWRSPSNRTAK